MTQPPDVVDHVDVADVRALVAAHCPQWSSLPVSAMPTSGTEHVTFRLGQHLVVRLPRDASAARGLRQEVEWLPRLRSAVGLELPVVEHVGQPGATHPYAWTVNRWLRGTDASTRVLAGDVPTHWTDALAQTVAELRAVDLGEVDPHLLPRGSRGVHLAERVRGLDGLTDLVAGRLTLSPVRRVIDEALAAGTPDPGPVLLHADLIPGNLVVRGDRLVGLLDLGTLTTGYAAWDLTPAWWVLDRAGRERFRTLLDVDDVSWAWGRALAAVQGRMADWFYRPRDHALAPLGARAVAEALSD